MEPTGRLRLGVNIDHVATVRNARGSAYPDPVRAAKLAEEAGANGITAHLREDRRHITDADIENLMEALTLPLNFEMAATQEMQQIALRHKPHAVCIVPEKRNEITTEGGLDLNIKDLSKNIKKLQDNNMLVSLFVDPDLSQVEKIKKLSPDAVEIHTGSYARAFSKGIYKDELKQISDFAKQINALDINVHAGHGLNYHNLNPIVNINEIIELNIGHAIISRSVFVGLDRAVREIHALFGHRRY